MLKSAWELGRLHKQQNKNKQAIANYTEAVNALKAIRTDLVAVNSDVQFSFRESVEPVYRELVGLLLEGKPAQDNLVQARDLIESLQVAELDNFLQEACLDKAEQIDQIDKSATVVYPICTGRSFSGDLLWKQESHCLTALRTNQNNKSNKL